MVIEAITVNKWYCFLVEILENTVAAGIEVMDHGDDWAVKIILCKYTSSDYDDRSSEAGINNAVRRRSYLDFIFSCFKIFHKSHKNVRTFSLTSRSSMIIMTHKWKSLECGHFMICISLTVLRKCVWTWNFVLQLWSTPTWMILIIRRRSYIHGYTVTWFN